MIQPKLIVHGGLGSAAGFARGKDKERQSLERIAGQAYAFLQSHSAVETAVYAVSLLEDDPLFNAGTGSKIQSDGVIRMTASVMDGSHERFAGVINISDVRNPVQVARQLLNEGDRVLAGDGALAYARARGFLSHNAETPPRRKDYEERLSGATGTVGCVAIDAQGRLAAATSTGGKGYELPGRVSDSATVAGNYANAFACVSCTGIGEDIVNAAVAARIVTRVTDGMSLTQAGSKSIAELDAGRGSAGFIAIDAQGHFCTMATKPYLTYAVHDGRVSLF